MVIRAEQLPRALKSPKYLYFVVGDEPLLQLEAQDLIRNAFRAQGVSERAVFYFAPRTKLDELIQSSDNLSLFAERKLFEIRFEKVPDREQQTFLKNLSNHVSAEQVWLISCPKLDKKQLSSQWVKSLSEIGDVVQVWPVYNDQLPAWIHQRAVKLGIKLTNEACQLLADRSEGNLLATDQDLKKLALLNIEETIEIEQLVETVANNARYSVFELIDTALLGDVRKVTQMLLLLKSEGVAAVALISLLFREWNNMLTMSETLKNGASVAEVLKQNRVWSTRTRAVTRGLQSVSFGVWQQLVARAGHLDKLAKGQTEGNLWDEILTSLLVMGGHSLWKPSLKRIG